MKKLIFVLCALLLCFTGCGKDAKTSDKITVMASFYPMAEFARGVVGDCAEVQTLVPDGVEPHDWDPAPRDLSRLGRAKVFIYNGYVESWTEGALQTLNDRPIKAVQVGKELYNVSGHTDPHIWVSPAKAVLAVERITKIMCQADPKNSEQYTKQGKAYCEELLKLDAELKELSKQAKQKKFVTAHAAFGHLAADYGFEQIAVAGISPEEEPTPGRLRNLVQIIRREKVKYIFMETLASPKLTETLARETGVEILVLDPIEGLDEDGRKDKMNYLKLMQKNIQNLRKAMLEEK